MHELGIVMQVVAETEKAAKESGCEKVIKLRLEVGEVSSVVPELFRDCFEWAKKKTEFHSGGHFVLPRLQKNV